MLTLWSFFIQLITPLSIHLFSRPMTMIWQSSCQHMLASYSAKTFETYIILLYCLAMTEIFSYAFVASTLAAFAARFFESYFFGNVLMSLLLHNCKLKWTWTWCRELTWKEEQFWLECKRAARALHRPLYLTLGSFGRSRRNDRGQGSNSGNYYCYFPH